MVPKHKACVQIKPSLFLLGEYMVDSSSIVFPKVTIRAYLRFGKRLINFPLPNRALNPHPIVTIPQT